MLHHQTGTRRQRQSTALSPTRGGWGGARVEPTGPPPRETLPGKTPPAPRKEILSRWGRHDYLFIYLFIEGVQPSQPQRVSSGFSLIAEQKVKTNAI